MIRAAVVPDATTGAPGWTLRLCLIAGAALQRPSRSARAHKLAERHQRRVEI